MPFGDPFRFFSTAAKLDPLRPSRKFSVPKGDDETLNEEMKEKQAARAQRLLALAEKTYDDTQWVDRKKDFAAKLAADE